MIDLAPATFLVSDHSPGDSDPDSPEPNPPPA
jgi:hypothetical protein